MRSGEAVPSVTESASLSEALLEMTRKGLGMTAITNAAGQPIGIFTDGDLRRLFERGTEFHGITIADTMHRNPQTITPGRLAVEAVELMEAHKVNALLVVDETGWLVGALNMHDLLRAKVI
jgi:arabinose-5-phosphate isomerase